MGRLDLIDDWIALARKAGYNADSLATVCEISDSHLRRHFQRIYLRPPQEWLNEVRLWHAMQLICEGMLIKQVAAALNFSGASHLCNRFREYHGCTPKECVLLFRERSKRAREEGRDVILPWETAERSLRTQIRSKTVLVDFRSDFHHGQNGLSEAQRS